jgi:hypothetical protein
VFISESVVGKPVSTWNPLYGYLHGKRRAEDAVFERSDIFVQYWKLPGLQECDYRFPKGGTCLRPGFIYGARQVGPFMLRLQYLGKPLEFLGSFNLVNRVPMLRVLSSTVSVEVVAKAAIDAALGNNSKRVLSADDMKA